MSTEDYEKITAAENRGREKIKRIVDSIQDVFFPCGHDAELVEMLSCCDSERVQ